MIRPGLRGRSTSDPILGRTRDGIYRYDATIASPEHCAKYRLCSTRLVCTCSALALQGCLSSVAKGV